MDESSRRYFLGSLGTAAAGSLAVSRSTIAAPAGKPISVGFIGCGGRSKGLLSSLADHVQVSWACDPDASRANAFQKKSAAANVTGDLRRVLDDPTVDAVVIATPDHWHAPAAILACQAGKHVYVEKPQSHNVRESRLLLNAARQNNVVVQHGTQSRSNPLIADAIVCLRDGIIGDVLVAKAWNVQRRKNIGHQHPSEPPPGVDYDTWIGPAPLVPYQSNRFHYDWHWWHDFGTGDIGNDGTHEMDYARWGLGVEGLPSKVNGLGGKYHFDDDQQFPDTATCAFEWLGDGKVGSRRQMIFEMRLWSSSYPFNCDSGVEFYGTSGRMLLSKRGKLEIFDGRNRRIEPPHPKPRPQWIADHSLDFLDAITSGRRPNADVAIGHDTVSLVHLANIAVRLGRSLRIDPSKERILGDEEADALLTRTYRDGGHWGVPQ